ncbi:hypothetical protein IMSAGC009_01641 [Lachnospiraceae bacterium]|nr:hypothetical protein IMSAGC009_01641 [Lachnospiraceae bacterium]
MNLSKDLFLRYFSNKITQNELYVSIGVNDIEFEHFLLTELIHAYKQEDAEMIEYLIFTIFLAEEKLNIASFLDILNKLILCRWHKKHEDIALLLQKIRISESVEYLYKAVFLKPAYLEWDDNYAFEKKCIHAIAKCGNQEAVDKLKLLATNKNKIIRLCAEQQLQKVQNSIYL